jgi:hypothetical protein
VGRRPAAKDTRSSPERAASEGDRAALVTKQGGPVSPLRGIGTAGPLIRLSVRVAEAAAADWSRGGRSFLHRVRVTRSLARRPGRGSVPGREPGCPRDRGPLECGARVTSSAGVKHGPRECPCSLPLSPLSRDRQHGCEAVPRQRTFSQRFYRALFVERAL